MGGQSLAQHHTRQGTANHPGPPSQPNANPHKANQWCSAGQPGLTNPSCSQNWPSTRRRPGRGPRHEGGQFMDDTYLWSTSLPRLQSMATRLERQLEVHGMQIQPDKTQFIQSHDAPEPSTIKLGKETIQARAPNTPICVFHRWFPFRQMKATLQRTWQPKQE